MELFGWIGTEIKINEEKKVETNKARTKGKKMSEMMVKQDNKSTPKVSEKDTITAVPQSTAFDIDLNVLPNMDLNYLFQDSVTAGLPTKSTENGNINKPESIMDRTNGVFSVAYRSKRCLEHPP